MVLQVLEKSRSGDVEDGADLALWPAATKILKELGVGSTAPGKGGLTESTDFWEQKTYPVHLVRMAKVSKARGPPESNGSPPGVSKAGPEVDGNATATTEPAPEEVLKVVDMDAVVLGEGEPFQLVGRKALMTALLSLVEERAGLERGARVLRAEQVLTPRGQFATAVVVGAEAAGSKGPGGGSASGPASRDVAEGETEPPRQEERPCRVLVGADGIHSVCRREVLAAADPTKAYPGGFSGDHPRPAAGGASTSGPRYGGEVCFRGVLDLKDDSDPAMAGLRGLFEDDEERKPGSMSVVYGDRIRFSWGYLDRARETGYWFVKQLTDEKDGVVERGRGPEGSEGKYQARWPEPLRSFARLTKKSCSYVHRIQDRAPLKR